MNRPVIFIALAAGGVVAAAVLIFVVLPSEPVEQEIVEERPVAVAPSPAARSADPAAPREGTQPLRDEAADAAPEIVEPSAPAEVAPAVEVGTLRIDTDVPGAQVFIDRRFIGAAPVTAEDITPGTHQLNVSAEGFESIAMPIEVEAGQRDLMVRFREVRLDSAIDVVHRHGIGSCRGRLIATPAGIRYDTSNKGDAFATPLLTLETFQVDYLEKNLRVTLPKGRQFNFTDPEGSADRLFVFHRDVERARERLKRGDSPAN